jgi:hypothetical protein
MMTMNHAAILPVATAGASTTTTPTLRWMCWGVVGFRTPQGCANAEALRNVATTRGLPVISFSTGGFRRSSDNGGLTEYFHYCCYNYCR